MKEEGERYVSFHFILRFGCFLLEHVGGVGYLYST